MIWTIFKGTSGLSAVKARLGGLGADVQADGLSLDPVLDHRRGMVRAYRAYGRSQKAGI